MNNNDLWSYASSFDLFLGLLIRLSRRVAAASAVRTALMMSRKIGINSVGLAFDTRRHQLMFAVDDGKEEQPSRYRKTAIFAWEATEGDGENKR
ncbi:hypothetical protein L596_019341 [Steinernema carpocapsae]|uniref:Uncharacterized protein n=1 Tax=Steinernema carpocapsae TaxID=34508 RepID=A0A4U5MQS4_STECR|nr:hypothetical protein L596_019341 [Steinernema carpocapsae]